MSVVNLANIVMGLSALQIVNVPMFATLRRCVILFTIIVELVAFKKKPHCASIVACVTICTGALVAGYETLAVDGYGYGLVLVANFLTSIFSILQNWSARYDRM